ncbi:MAG: ferric reductase-like transmembrane domain-containing protein, partial [Thermoplasmatota archaeon]
PPNLGETILGAIPPVDLTDTSNPGNFLNEQTDFVNGFVEAGTTDLKITITPENTDANIGPQLSARMYPGRSEPPSSPTTNYRAQAPGPGQPAVLHLQSGSDISDAGFGTWTVEVYLTPVSAGGSPTNVVGEVAYSVTFDKYYNVTGENVQFLSKTVSLDAGQATAFGWILVANDVPGPGEYITVDMNTTTYYLHDAHESSTYPDYAYINRNFRFDLSAGGEGLQFSGTPQTGTTQDLALGVTVTKISEIVGYVSAVLLIASIYTGGMFGKATRRHQNSFFGAAKRRVAFHNFLSYGIITMAVIHLVLFVGPWEKSFYWTNGLIWGGIGIIAMLLLGVTGAIQVPMIRKWNYATWRWTHFGLAIAAIVFTLVHMFLDGANLAPTLDFVEWKDPFDPRI